MPKLRSGLRAVLLISVAGCATAESDRLPASTAAASEPSPAVASRADDALPWVYVVGAVHRPGRHPFLKGRSAFTVTKLLALADDFTPSASRHLRVVRESGGARDVIDVDFDAIITTDAPDVELRPGDVVYASEKR